MIAGEPRYEVHDMKVMTPVASRACRPTYRAFRLTRSERSQSTEQKLLDFYKLNKRLADGAESATANREFQILRRAFVLGFERQPIRKRQAVPFSASVKDGAVGAKRQSSNAPAFARYPTPSRLRRF
jgi:hypothetical protein